MSKSYLPMLTSHSSPLKRSLPRDQLRPDQLLRPEDCSGTEGGPWSTWREKDTCKSERGEGVLGALGDASAGGGAAA